MLILASRTEAGGDRGLRLARTRGRRPGLSLTVLVALLSGCGGGEPEARVPVVRESGEDQVFRIASAWESRWEDKGFRPPPSRISMFTTSITSKLAFVRGKGTAEETLTIEEAFKMSDGAEYQCRGGAKVTVTARFGDHAGETAVETRRPALRISRECNRPGFPEGALELEAAEARFALRGDRLVPLSPPKERREYIPAF